MNRRRFIRGLGAGLLAANLGLRALPEVRLPEGTWFVGAWSDGELIDLRGKALTPEDFRFGGPSQVFLSAKEMDDILSCSGLR